jgi:hypothetical protein
MLACLAAEHLALKAHPYYHGKAARGRGLVFFRHDS